MVATKKPKMSKQSKVKSVRGIIRGVRSAWIFYCNDQRPILKKKNPDLAFGDICKHLAPMWRNLSASEKKRYMSLQVKDKQRYVSEKASLTTEQKQLLKQCRRKRKTLRAGRPKNILSPYMFFVMSERGGDS